MRMRAAACVGLGLALSAGCAHHGPPSHRARLDCAIAVYTLMEVSELAADLPCAHTVDLDGDGRLDEVFLSADHGSVFLGVVRGGREEWVSEVTRREVGEPGSRVEAAPDLVWLTSWRVATPAELARAPDALGGALWLSGSDAAALFYRSPAGWVLLELGY